MTDDVRKALHNDLTSNLQEVAAMARDLLYGLTDDYPTHQIGNLIEAQELLSALYAVHAKLETALETMEIECDPIDWRKEESTYRVHRGRVVG